MIDNKSLPASIAGVFATGLTLYARRLPLYATLAFLALVVQYVVDVRVMQEDTGFMAGLAIVIDGFLAAAVSIGIALDLAGQEADWSRIITAASLRWGVVTLTQFAAAFVASSYQATVFTVRQDPGGIFALLAFTAFYGVMFMAGVAGAIEPAKSRWQLPAIAFGKGFLVSAQFVNLGRLVVLSALLTIPVLIALYLESTIPRNFADADFLVNVPVDVITIGPLVAIATVFYVDFLRRLKR